MINYKIIEACYLGYIKISNLQKELGFDHIDIYDFAKELIRIAEYHKNSDAIHIAFLIFDDYELKEDDFNLLNIFFHDWHDAHEDIVFTVSKIINCKLIDFFYSAIFFIPNYLKDDDCRALARKSFFGLGNNMKCVKAVEYLRKFELGEDELLSGFAKEQFSINRF
ncbi:hypothetical protein F909_01355 [Acinetobacter sp. ANC 3929]|uniref:hypothetical protein n=1 Tax=unclassified Acinetobacter TaxID=196816 RepID=UPI0002CF9A36|nr:MULTISPECIES: hypothetical protein [unclassified Acinetobacter]ENW81671.1 hypothetical protein F909_01355 [Acinetobacter sp. ANC 3929]MCH7353923.1 hypothetical protein [Acinetobacter sp. NIPH 2023]MCH7356833.1 hypothetical protein [Acinetobacter sp. NIPH 1958]MCH7361257.1 hypothetical protein [Acinetobacter sp. NIPH 2024]